MTSPRTAPARPAWLTPTIDYLGPIAFVLGFFLMHRSLLGATWWLVGGSVAALGLSLVATRRIAPMPAVWGGSALVFGLLTLVFHDPTIVKMKTTFIDAALGVALIVGRRLKRNPLQAMMGGALTMSDAAWGRLTLRYAVFFLGMAALNEVVWRTQPDAVWILFRMPGLLLLALAFSVTQAPRLMGEMKRQEAIAKLAELQE